METKLPEDFKKKWVAALRSGEYKQGKGRLFRDDDDTYCCLGVACAVTGQPVKLTWFIPHDAILVPEILRGSSNLPKTLSLMNDGTKDGGKRYTFSEIADYIEKNL